jgi:thiol-disulfide isomerase/thioredoxin
MSLDVSTHRQVKDLPSDFLSTPFGAALRPTIDAMFRGPSPGVATPTPPATSQDPQLAASILQSVASQAQSQPGPSTRATNSLTGPLHIITNPASFNHFLKAHRAAVALFTAPQTCPPCRVIEPVFDRLAEEKGIREGRNGAAFAKIDINVGMGQSLASRMGDSSNTHIFIFP